MNKIAILFGLLLIAVGLIGYFGTPSAPAPAPTPSAGESSTVVANNSGSAAQPDAAKKKSKTALIPAVFGTLILMCGTLALESRWRKHAMHAAAGVALLGGVAASYMFLTKLPGLLSSDPAFNRRSPIFIGLMALLCIIYIVLSIRSFIQARRAAQA